VVPAVQVPRDAERWPTFWPPRPAAALFQVVSQRYLKGSIALTTNLGIASWRKVFTRFRLNRRPACHKIDGSRLSIDWFIARASFAADLQAASSATEGKRSAMSRRFESTMGALASSL
jgi:hypothetical protein